MTSFSRIWIRTEMLKVGWTIDREARFGHKVTQHGERTVRNHLEQSTEPCIRTWSSAHLEPPGPREDRLLHLVSTKVLFNLSIFHSSSCSNLRMSVTNPDMEVTPASKGAESSRSDQGERVVDKDVLSRYVYFSSALARVYESTKSSNTVSPTHLHFNLDLGTQLGPNAVSASSVCPRLIAPSSRNGNGAQSPDSTCF